MLVFADGGQLGTLGGGCVEAEVRQRVLRDLGLPSARLHTFHLDDNYGWDDGLICGGRMTIHVQPFPRPHAALIARALEYFERMEARLESGAGFTEVLGMGAPSAEWKAESLGQRFLFDEGAKLLASLASDGVEALTIAPVLAHLIPAARRPRPAVRGGVAYLPTWPRITLLIVGGGHVGEAVARLASEVDFDVWVLDDRQRYASPERFPMARRRIVGDIGASLKQLAREITPATFCIVVTRGHSHDEEAVYHLVRTSAGYVGMIGSNRKKRLIFEDLLAKGVPRECLDRVRSPIGLPIGSQTVGEIAVSIVAELIACRNGGEAARRNGEPGACAS